MLRPFLALRRALVFVFWRESIPGEFIASLCTALWVALSAGSYSEVSVLRLHTLAADGTTVASAPSSSAFALTDSLARVSATFTLPADANIAYVTLCMGFGQTTGGAYDFSVDIVAPQFEQARFASTPILPPAGTLAASTRAADVATVSLTAAEQSAMTVWGTALISNAAADGVDHVVVQRDDGTDNNRIAIVNPSGGATLVLRRVVGGTVTDTAARRPPPRASCWGAASCKSAL